MEMESATFSLFIEVGMVGEEGTSVENGDLLEEYTASNSIKETRSTFLDVIDRSL
jgi:hypothetical protein